MEKDIYKGKEEFEIKNGTGFGKEFHSIRLIIFWFNYSRLKL